MSSQESFEGLDDSPQVSFILVIVVQPLSIQDIMHGHQTLVLMLNSRSVTSELLHLTSNTEKETKMNAECSDISSGFATDPEDAHVPLIIVLDELALVDGADTKLTLDG